MGKSATVVIMGNATIASSTRMRAEVKAEVKLPSLMFRPFLADGLLPLDSKHLSDDFLQNIQGQAEACESNDVLGFPHE
jgi:hypothetical protein